MSGRGGHHGGKRERGQQPPFQGRVRRWRKQWVAAKATKIGVTLMKWIQLAEVAVEDIKPRNMDLVPVLAADARPPLPKLLRKLPEAVPPRQRSTRVRMIGPGGYAELEMDDVALEGGPAHVPSPVHWSQQQVAHVGGSAPLAPVVGPAGFLPTLGPSRLSGVGLPQSLQQPMMRGPTGAPLQPSSTASAVAAAVAIAAASPAHAAIQATQYAVSNLGAPHVPLIAQESQPEGLSISQSQTQTQQQPLPPRVQSEAAPSEQDSLPAMSLDPITQAREVQQPQSGQAAGTESVEDVNREQG